MGTPKKQLTQILKKAGWKKSIITKLTKGYKPSLTYIIKSLEKRITKLKQQDEKDKQNIITFIKAAEKRGISRSQIREELINSGWNEQYIIRFLNPEVDLKEYINTHKKLGTPTKKLLKILLVNGWRKDLILKHLKKYKPSLTGTLRRKIKNHISIKKKKKLNKKHIKAYIEMEELKGIQHQKIRDALLKKGWKEEYIDKYLSPLEDLKKYIKHEQNNNTPNQEIRNNLLKAGWDEKYINKYINPLDDLKKYIKDLKKKKVPKESIKRMLRITGWKEEIINKYIK